MHQISNLHFCNQERDPKSEITRLLQSRVSRIFLWARYSITNVKKCFIQAMFQFYTL